MKSALFFHIGLHKTGSTAIQQLLLQNQERLVELGYYRPLTGAETHRHSHDDLARAIDGRAPARAAGLIDKLAGELRDAGEPRFAVVSAEGLSRNIENPSLLDRLADISSRLGYRPHVVAYVRPQAQAINSAYTQRVKTWHARETFSHFFASQLESPLYDYRTRLAPLLADRRFAVTIRPYNRAVLTDGLCTDFLMTIGLSQSQARAFSIPRLYNVSPGPKTIAAMLHIARRLEAEKESIPPELLTAMSRPVISIADSYGWNAEKFDGVNRRRLSMAEDRFREANEAFAKIAWGRSWDEVFPEEKERPATPNVFDLRNANAAERDQFLGYVEEATAALRDLAASADTASLIAMAEEES